ncbi:MAG: hypothetical protein ACRDRS_19590 [Pseudonocardiaceae bacterium]
MNLSASLRVAVLISGELSNGDVAVIGRDLTDVYVGRLPNGVSVAEDERLVILPGVILSAAKRDFPDA